MKVFIEYGFDIDNNKYLLGKSVEIETKNIEYRTKTHIKLKQIDGFYIRIWIFKLVVIISTFTPIFKLQHKTRNNIKVVFGISGRK